MQTFIERGKKLTIGEINNLTERLRKKLRPSNSFKFLILISIFIFGTLLRFTNLNWDSYQALHPDERNIAWAVTRIHFFDELNPKFFAYGGLPIYLYRALGEGVRTITKNEDWVANWGHINILGRLVSASLASISIFLIYQVGNLYFDWSVGLLAAFSLAFSPWAIQQAHFDTTETMLVFFLLILTCESFALYRKAKITNILKVSLIWGLALGAKTTSLLFAVIPLTALWLPNLSLSLFKLSSLKKILLPKIMLTLIFFLTGGFFFLLTSPYTILDSQDFLTSMRYESGVALGQFSVPYTLQFLHTIPYLYQIVTMIWQAGPVAIIGIIGLFLLLLKVVRGEGKQFLRELAPRLKFIWSLAISAGRHLARKKNSLQVQKKSYRASRKNSFAEASGTILIFLSFPLVYGLWAGSWYAKFARYNVPFLPFVTLAAAWLLIKIFRKFHLAGFALVALTACIAFLWTMANWTIYLRPNPEIVASRWLIQNIPSQATIFTEHWNDGLPLGLPDLPAPNFKRELLTVYDEDNQSKLLYYSNMIPRADFIVLSTRRIWATMPGLTEKYPLTSKFYRKLLNGELGFREVVDFSSYPGLWGIQVNDDTAEESLQVFDHPKVRIFQNQTYLTQAELYRILSGSLTN